MVETGRTKTLRVAHLDRQGAWLQDGDDLVLLPRSELSEHVRPGDDLRVFIWGEAAGRWLATLRRPRAEVGEFALFPVSQVTEHGVFLDWGIGKELLVPFSKQPQRLESGRQYLVKVCRDRRGRPFGNARIEQCLEPVVRDLEVGAPVTLTLWEFTDLGARVIVDQRFAGLLYRDELKPGMHPGDRLQGYVKALRPDGKLDVTLRPGPRAELEEARATILAALQPDGFLPLHDHSPPEAVRSVLGMSKKLFKKAIGSLYRDGLVNLTSDGVRKTASATGRQKRRAGGKKER